MFGYFAVFGANPWLFYQFSYLNGSLGCYCPQLWHRKDKLCHGYVAKHYTLAGSGTSGSDWLEEEQGVVGNKEKSPQ